MAQIQIVFFLLLLTSLGSSQHQRYPRFLGFGSSSNTEKTIPLPSLPPPPQLPQLPQLAAHLQQLFQQKPIVYNVRYIERTPDIVNQNHEQKQIPLAVPVSLPVPVASPAPPVVLDEIKPTERVYLNIYGQGNHGQPYYDRVTGQVLVPCPYYNHQIGPGSTRNVLHASSEVTKPVVQQTQAKKQVVRQKPVVVGSTVPYPDYYQQLYQQQFQQQYQQQIQQQQQQQYQPIIYVDPYYLLKNLYGQSPYPGYGYPGISSVVQHSVQPPVVQVPRERERIVSVQDEQTQVKPTDITKEPQDDE